MAKSVKSGKAVIIAAIVKEIEKGESRGKVLGKIGKKWEISRTTFDRYWKTANQEHAELQIKAKAAADEAYVQASAEAAKKAVMSKAERLEVLSNIARGELTQVVPGVEGKEATTEPVFIETLERIKAISEINKMEGDYAPTKVDQTTVTYNIEPTPEEAAKIKAAFDKSL